MQFKAICAACVLISGALVGNAQASSNGLAGDKVEAVYYNQSTTEPLRQFGEVVQNVVSDTGTSFAGVAFGAVHLTISDSQIVFNNFWTSDSFTYGSFSGFLVKDLSKSFASASFNSATTMAGLAQSNIKLDGNSLWLDWAGKSFTPGTQVILDVKTVSPVPEPDAYAMMLAGVAFVGLLSRRRAHTAV